MINHQDLPHLSKLSWVEFGFWSEEIRVQ
jgi:hypothetical protein